MEFLERDGVQYVLQYPNGFSADGAYPVLFFFHGAGSRGKDIAGVLDNPFFELYPTHGDLPFVVVAPLCSENTWFDMWERIKGLVGHIVSLPFVDRDRICVMGASMGGYATWQLAMSMPEVFCAIVPICGGGMYWNASRLTNLPVWAFHGALDPTVSVTESEKMVEAVKARGGNARLTIYPKAGHNAWTDTYANREVFEWLLAQRREGTNGVTDPYNNAKAYG